MIVAKTKMERIPEYCCECDLLSDDAGLFGQFKPYDYCGVTYKKVKDLFVKPDWCPLFEVKSENLQ